MFVILHRHAGRYQLGSARVLLFGGPMTRAGDAMAELERLEERSEVKLTRRQLLVAVGIAVLTGLALGLILAARVTLLGEPAPTELELQPGRPSPSTILAPERVTFASALYTAQAREQAARAVADIYDPPDANVAREQVRRVARILDFVETVRADPYASLQEKADWVMAIPAMPVSREIVSRTLALDAHSYRQVISETLYVLDQAMRDEIRENDVAAARSKVASRISLVLSAEQADLVKSWVEPFIIANTRLNVEKTVAARERAAQEVSIVYRTIEKGQAVVRAGEMITPEIAEVLRELGYLNPPSGQPERIAAFLFAALLVAVASAYLGCVAPPLLREPRVLLILSFLLLVSALGAKIVIPGGTLVAYLFPFAATAMLGAALLNISIGVGLAIAVALIVGYLTRLSVELAMYALSGGLVAVVALRRRERLTAFLLTGLYVAVANVALVAIFRLVTREEDLSNLARLLSAAFGSGALTGLIALSSQFVLGKVAGITTALELIELSRPTHPLLQKLLREAPGSYHHSLIISNLAEHAAQRIGADALLCRVGAYYHDVGKTMNPQFFVENQFDGVNPHHALDPRTSVAILQQHVTDGENLARKYRISKRVRDLIPQHHGTTLAVYFYEKALAQSHGAPVDEQAFRYPGPKPQTREAAILMLADGVEATARAERPTNANEIRQVIDRIFEQRIRDGQLDEVDITLRDLEQIKQAFLEVLQGLYHPRVKYPTPTVSAHAEHSPVGLVPTATPSESAKR